VTEDAACFCLGGGDTESGASGDNGLKQAHKGCWLVVIEITSKEEHVSEADAATSVNVAERLGFKDGDLIQEFGYDDDVDFDLRDDIEELTGSELLDEDDHDVVDAVIFWWRDGDGDLVDALVDSQTTLSEGGVVWVLTPKSGRSNHVSPSDIQDAAPTAGLHCTTSAGVSKDWSATRLVARKKNK
jgi:hypothetical protein